MFQDEIDSIVLPFQDQGAGLRVLPNTLKGKRRLMELVEREDKLMLCLTHVFWTRGWTMFDLPALLQVCAKKKIPVFFDLTQSLGILDYNVASFPAELHFILCGSVHKHLMGMHGLSLCYVSDRFLEDPLLRHRAVERHSKQLSQSHAVWDECAGGMTATGYALDDRLDSAGRYDAGFSNPAGLAVVSASLELILSWGALSEYRAYLTKLSGWVKEELEGLGLLVEGDSPHILSFTSPKGFEETARIQQQLKEAQIFTDLRQSGIRVGFGCYNDQCDGERLITKLKQII
jgi:selenocysteine lyase/cysteine desulfurase